MPRDKKQKEGETTVGRTFPDLISEFPKTSILIGLILFVFIVFIIAKGYGIELPNITITPPKTEEKKANEAEVKSANVGKENEGTEFIQREKDQIQREISTLKKKKRNLNERASSIIDETEKRLIKTQIGLIDIEIDDLEKELREK